MLQFKYCPTLSCLLSILPKDDMDQPETRRPTISSENILLASVLLCMISVSSKFFDLNLATYQKIRPLFDCVKEDAGVFLLSK